MFQVDYNEVIQELLTYMRYSSDRNDKEKKKSNFPCFKGGQLILYLHSKMFFFPH